MKKLIISPLWLSAKSVEEPKFCVEEKLFKGVYFRRYYRHRLSSMDNSFIFAKGGQ
jgi:hypothetical protein